MNYGMIFSDELQKQGTRAIPDEALIEFLKKTKQHKRLFDITQGKGSVIDPLAERGLFMSRTLPEYRAATLKGDILSRMNSKIWKDRPIPDVALREYNDHTDAVGLEAYRRFIEERREAARQSMLDMFRNMKLTKKPKPFNSSDIYTNT